MQANFVETYIHTQQEMKALKITYWFTTGIVSLMMLLAAYSYLTNPQVKVGFAHLGFPDYFRIELAIAKIAGAIVLLLPIWSQLKEWAYAGFVFTFISAFIAHTASGDPVSMRMMPVILGLILGASYYTLHRKKTLQVQ